MADLAKVGDPVTCPLCGPNHIATGSPDTFLDGQPVALTGFSQTDCGATIISGLSWFYINRHHAAVHGSTHSHGGVVLASSTAKTGSPGVSASSGAPDFNHVKHEGMSYKFAPNPAEPELKGGLTFIAEPERVCVFAKSCTVPTGTVLAGTTPEPIENFGKAIVLGSTAVAGSGGGATLGRVAGQSILEGLGSWGLHGAATVAGATASTLLLALWPSSLGDGTLYTEDELRRVSAATTRVRFQFRRDVEGVMRAYGIHTSSTLGMDSVPVVNAYWDTSGSSMEAYVGGITITWTPNDGPVVQAPTTYPGVTSELETILVHPVAEGTDSQIEIYPASDDLTWQDCILVFPQDSGVPPLYLVFAKPMVNPLEVGIYSDLSSRSRRDGLDVDHIPARAALKKHILANFPELPPEVIADYLSKAPSIAIPARVHQRYSETYGGRNTKTKQALDATNLKAAVNSNFDAIKPGLLEEGLSEAEIETSRAELHKLHEEQGWY